MANISTISLEEQLTLRIDRGLKEQLDNIITTMQKIANKFNIKQVKERSPFKNLLSVATEPTSSLEVIKNYIRYQAGRKESSKVWKIEVVAFATECRVRGSFNAKRGVTSRER